MGSIEAACVTGFLCRLCSEMHRTVIHIYGDQGQKHDLAKKINAYLPVTIAPNDPLPKTICKICMAQVEKHHDLITTMEKHKILFEAQEARVTRLRNGETRTRNSTITTSSNSRTEPPVVSSSSRRRRIVVTTVAGTRASSHRILRSTNANRNSTAVSNGTSTITSDAMSEQPNDGDVGLAAREHTNTTDRPNAINEHSSDSSTNSGSNK